MINNKELLDFISKNKFNTGNTQGWIDFTKRLVKKFKLKTTVKEGLECAYITISNGEEKDIENAYSHVKSSKTTLKQIFGCNIVYK